MTKNSLLFIVLIAVINVYGQGEDSIDKHKNIGYFNITRFSTIPLFNAKLETFDTTNGKVITDLPTNKSTAFSLQTINGYFINPIINLTLLVLNGNKRFYH